jgi:glycosyltransferase involved in cell wall biosynthesis
MLLRHKLFGARFYGGQIDRIEQGLVELGSESDDYNCGFVFSNDMGRHDEAIAYRRDICPKAKLILGVQDCAPHLGAQFPLETLKQQLRRADAITTISTFVQNDVRNRLGLESTVIYNPIKDVVRDAAGPTAASDSQNCYPYRFMFCGRVNDPAKRCGFGAAALQILGASPLDVITVGGEPPFYGGMYWGVASDQALRDIYHTVDFVLMPSASEGMGLPAIEAMAVGAIPVICCDLVTREEFFPSSVFPEYLSVEPTPQSIATFIARYLNNREEMAAFKARLKTHFAQNWAHKMSGRGVAEAILKVYESLS